MAKPSLYVVRHEGVYPFLRKLLENKFDIEFSETPYTTTDELLKKMRGKFGLICPSTENDPIIDENIFKASGGTLKVVCITSVGLETVNISSLKSCGIKIGYSPFIGTENTAEMAMALLLSVGRRIHEFGKQSKRTTNDRLHYVCRGLQNSIVGIVGCGRIGTSVARKLKAFEPQKILYYARSEKPEVNTLGGELISLKKLMTESDFIVVTMALSEETKNIINKEVISWMKSSAIFVNVGRGALVDTDALTEALANNKIAGAGLDVTNPEPLPDDHLLLKLNNTVITPHLGGDTYQFITSSIELIVKNLNAALEGKPLETSL